MSSHLVIEGTRNIRGRIIGTESLPEKVGKVTTLLRGGDLVVVGCCVVDTTNGKQHLDALVSTVLEILLNGAAVVEQLSLDALAVGEPGGPAMRSEVNAREAGRVVLGRRIDKAQSNVVGTLVAAVLKALFSRTTLTLYLLALC